jgi:hypothetical protein
MNQSPQLETIKKNGIMAFRFLKTFVQFNMKHIVYYFQDFNTTFLTPSTIELNETELSEQNSESEK